MMNEMLIAKRFLGIKFGYGERIRDGIYAIPIDTSKGKAFIKLEMKNGNAEGNDNFSLFWDEELSNSWYYTKTPPTDFKESEFSRLFREIEAIR